MIIHNEGQTASFGPSLILAATFLSLIVVAVKSASCFKRKHEDDVPSTVDSFTISRWSCLCNWWGKSDPLRWTDDDNKFTTDSVKSMNIKKEPKKVRDGKSYLPKGVDGVGSSTKKFLELAPEQMLPQADRRELEDNRLVMKAYLISKLVAARYDFADGEMTFQEQAEEKQINVDDYKQRTQNMYDLLYAGQISVDTKATRKQQRNALKRLKKSNMNNRPKKIKELAKQMKEEPNRPAPAAVDRQSSGIGSTGDISKADTTTVATTTTNAASNSEYNASGSKISQFLRKFKFKSSRDSAVGSSLGSIDQLGGVAVKHTEKNNNWATAKKPSHITFAGAQF